MKYSIRAQLYVQTRPVFFFLFGLVVRVLSYIKSLPVARRDPSRAIGLGRARRAHHTPHRTVKGVNPVEDAKHFLQFSAWRVRADWLFLFFSAGRAPRFVRRSKFRKP